MNVRWGLLVYSVQRHANARMEESATTLVVHAFVSQDTLENAVKQDYALKVSMASNVTKGVPAICQTLTGMCPLYVNSFSFLTMFLSRFLNHDWEVFFKDAKE